MNTQEITIPASSIRKRSNEYGKTHTVYAPQVATEAERLEAEHNAVADKQELEVLAADGREA